MKRGIKIGNYVLAELLNTGGMGQVWLAHREFDGGGQMAVAIKFPHAAGVLDPRIREGLLDEARLQMRLQHPNIPRVVDMGVHEGLPYFVMDYIAGCSLAQLLSRMRDIGTPLRFELVAHIAREIGYALRYAHGYQSQGEHLPVIHRDVAPKNVLISGQGGVYVVDFGVSEAAGIHTSRNFVKGTLLYMAPEHALGFPSTKSDGWGLGAILWEMIEGRQFRGEIEADDLRRAANDGRCGALTRAGIPETLRFVTEGLLRVDERERLTLDEVLNPLERNEFPAQRSPLADLLRRRFGPAVHRSGQTLHDFKMPELLDRTIAAAKVVKDAGPHGLDTWSEEAFSVAGAPVVVPVGGTRPIPRAMALDDDEDSAPRFVGRPEPRAGGEAQDKGIAPAEDAAPTEAPASDQAAPTAREQRVAAVEADDWRPQRTEHLPRVPTFGAHPEPMTVRTEPVPPPSGARARDELASAPDAPQITERAAEPSAPTPRTHPTTLRVVQVPEVSEVSEVTEVVVVPSSVTVPAGVVIAAPVVVERPPVAVPSAAVEAPPVVEPPVVIEPPVVVEPPPVVVAAPSVAEVSLASEEMTEPAIVVPPAMVASLSAAVSSAAAVDPVVVDSSKDDELAAAPSDGLPPPIGMHALDITAVWEIERPASLDAPTDRDHPLPQSSPRSTSAPQAAQSQAVRGEVWVDVELDHEAPPPPSVPTLPPAAATPTPAPASSSGPVRVEPAPVQHRRWAPWALVIVIVLWLTVGGGLLWGAWPLTNEGREAKPTAQNTVVADAPVPVAAPAEPEPAPEPAVHLEPAVEIAPAPQVDADAKAATAAPQAEPETPLVAESAPSNEPAPPPEPTPAPEPMTTVEPAPASEPAAAPSQPSKPKSGTKKPAPKKAADGRLPLPPSKVRIALMVGAPMDIEIDGVHRSLTMDRTVDNVEIRPGTVKVRWRRPGGEWKGRKVVIEPGVDYHVRLDPSGATFKTVPRKTP